MHSHFHKSYPLAVALLESYRLSTPRRYLPDLPDSKTAAPHPLRTIRRVLLRLPVPVEYKHAVWFYFIGGKQLLDIADAMHYSDRHIQRMISKTLSTMESYLSTVTSSSEPLLLPPHLTDPSMPDDQPSCTLDAILPPWEDAPAQHVVDPQPVS